MKKILFTLLLFLLMSAYVNGNEIDNYYNQAIEHLKMGNNIQAESMLMDSV